MNALAELQAEVEQVEREAEQAVAQSEPASVPGKRGRPPKHKCPGCGAPLAKKAVCKTCVAIPSPTIPDCIEQQSRISDVARPAWEPLQIDDLRARLEMLERAGVEAYEDGPIKIKFDPEARRLRQLENEKNTTRW